MSEAINVAKIFGEDVFNDTVMQERLPKKVYKDLKKTIEELKSADAVDQEALSKAETALKEAESKIFTPMHG